MPDDELMRLAERGELRANLPAQVARMLKDSRSEALAENFAGQWLRARDIEHLEIDPIGALGLQHELDELQREAVPDCAASASDCGDEAEIATSE